MDDVRLLDPDVGVLIRPVPVPGRALGVKVDQDLDRAHPLEVVHGRELALGKFGSIREIFMKLSRCRPQNVSRLNASYHHPLLPFGDE